MTDIPESVYAKHPVYQDIKYRLEKAGVSGIGRFIQQMIKVGPSTLDGIKFLPKNKNGSHSITELSELVEAAKSASGKRSFAGGAADKHHQNLTLSMLATDGTGYREIYYLDESPRTELAEVRADWAFASKFSGLSLANKPADTSSLHLDLGHTCNIHVDQAGFVFAGPDGTIYLSADSIQHTADELLIKDKLYSVPVIGNAARYINLSLQLRLGDSPLENAGGGSDMTYRPHSVLRDMTGTLSIEVSKALSEDVRLRGRGTVGYNEYGDRNVSYAATGSLEFTFDEDKLFRK